MKTEINFALKEYNTFGLNVFAKSFLEFNTLQELKEIFSSIGSQRWYVLGGGSNTLFTKDFDGLIIHPTANTIEIVSQNSSTATIRAGAGCVWDDLVQWSIDNNLYGLENLSHIPGSVGASPIQNIGAYGVEAKDYISLVEFYSPQQNTVVTYSNSQCEFGYRDSVFKNSLKNCAVVLNVEFTLNKKFIPNLNYGNISTIINQSDSITAQIVRDKIIEIREEKLPNPQIIGNGGSFFKNPFVDTVLAEQLLVKYPTMPSYPSPSGVKIPAGWLIEQCGWKGRNLGNAGVHKNQALVLINLGDAKPQEIVELSSRIVADVYDKFGVRISPEINFI